MAWRDTGNVAVNSTAGPATNPDTATLIAEIDSTQLAGIPSRGQLFMVTWIPGASTNAIWALELATSTAITTAAQADVTFVQTAASQSGAFVLSYKVEPSYRLRARVINGITGTATAKISAEPLT